METDTRLVLRKERLDDPDAPLIERMRNGDPRAFDEIVARNKDRVYNLLYRFLGNHEDALDIAQETFVRAYHGLDAFRGHARVHTWLYAIAANLARNRIRDRQRKGRNRMTSLDALREQHGDALIPAATGGPQDHAQQRELQEAMEACLESLPEQFRFAFVLRVMDELSYQEIATAAACPPGTVKSRLNQARRLLGECLRQKGVL